MSTSPEHSPPSAQERPEATAAPSGNSTGNRERRFIERPDPGEQPIGFLRMMVILMSSHIGVRSRANREEDFRRANGLHVFVAAVIYFLLIVTALIVLAVSITSG